VLDTSAIIACRRVSIWQSEERNGFEQLEADVLGSALELAIELCTNCSLTSAVHVAAQGFTRLGAGPFRYRLILKRIGDHQWPTQPLRENLHLARSGPAQQKLIVGNGAFAGMPAMRMTPV